MKLDILAIGVHPDDVELCCGGILIKEIQSGKIAGIVDLTQGELGTRGSKELRLKEAAAAAAIMGVSVRENLYMRDGFFRNDEEHQLKLISTIRKYQPDIILGNILNDRHPDHGRAGELIKTAAFLSGLSKIETVDEHGNPQDKWRPSYTLQYMQDWYHEPDLLIDITDVMELKIKAIEAYSSQFYTGATDENNEPQTYISTSSFKDSIYARCRMLGKRIGVEYAEAIISTKTIGLNNLNALLLKET